MLPNQPGLVKKLRWNAPWMLRYPVWSMRQLARSLSANSRTTHMVIVVANHFEPAYNEHPNSSGGLGIPLTESEQLIRLDDWCKQARAIGNAVKDHDGTPFRHTNFYPAEQYYKSILNRLAELQADGFGEVEIHLHHGVVQPDTASNFKRVLIDFRDALAEEHRCLSRTMEDERPRYAFVHGNWALANSAGGKFCGVDSEMQILAETGCYADLTLPSAPDQSQVPRINVIYECGRPLEEAIPHRSGPALRVGRHPAYPILLTGPLVLDWKYGLLSPRLENGSLTAQGPLDRHRATLWRRAGISVEGRPEWIFVKLYCHGFFPGDQPAVIGDTIRRGLEELLDEVEKSGGVRIHFATAREAFNMIMAAVDRQNGEPGEYRDYKLLPIMKVDSIAHDMKKATA